MEQLISFSAYHGTFLNNLKTILEIGFQPSVNDNDWLGFGTYFFIDGLNDPMKSAIDWAICSSWDKELKHFKENDIAVVKVELTFKANSVFDLRKIENAKLFHLFRKRWIENQLYSTQHSSLTDITRPKDRTYDTTVLNEFREKHGIDVLISNFHIQLSVHERYLRLDSRIPNVSVLCLKPINYSTIQFSISEVEIINATSWLSHIKI